MLLKLKKEQSVKLKISIVFIWLIAIMIILNDMHDSYLMYVGEYEYPAFSFLPSYMHYIYMGFGLLIAIGLLVRSRVVRWFILLFSYLPLFGILYYLLAYGTLRGMPVYMFILGMGFYILTIYLLSHDDILKVFKVKSLKGEIVFYLIFSVILYVFFTWYIKSMTDDFDNKIVFDTNTSIERGNK